MKKTLIVVDMLNDFAHPEGILFFPDAEKIIERIKNIINDYRHHGDTIIFICDNHDPDDKEFERFPVHAVKDTWGAEIIEDLKPLEDEIVITKKRYSGFYGTHLGAHLNNSKTVEVCGVCTSICVMDTVGGLANRDYDVWVDHKAVADFDPKMHEFSLTRMENIYGAKIPGRR